MGQSQLPSIDLNIKKHLKIQIDLASKNWTIATEFIIAVILSNFSNSTPARIRTKKL